jgi:tetratricopeptide (TPR) repeat protein
MLKKLLICGCLGLGVLTVQAFDSYLDAFNSGLKKTKASDWAEAAKDYAEAATLGKTDTEKANAYYYLGESLRNNKMRNEAMEAYAKGVALENAAPDIRALSQNMIGAVCRELGKRDQGIEEYKKTFNLTKAAPSYSQGARIGIAYILCEQKKYTEAIAFYQEIIDSENVYAPFLNEAQFTIGQCYYNLGDKVKAKEAFEKVLTLKTVDAAYKKKTEDMLAKIASEK